MKNLIDHLPKSAVAGLAMVLTSAVSTRGSQLQVPVDYPTIQSAVDSAAPGDEIEIAAGVYTEQVVITNKHLTLSGSPGAVLRAAPGMAQTFAAYGFSGVALLGVALSDVRVSGLTFEGEHLAESQSSWFDAISYLGSSGSVEDCRIIGFRGSTLFTADKPWPAGIFCGNPRSNGTGVMNFEVKRCVFADNAISIWLVGDFAPYPTPFDPNSLRLTFSVTDNSIVGNGPDATGRQFGTLLYAGVGGEIRGNTIIDHVYVGTTWDTPYSIGIVAVDNEDFSRRLPLAALQPMHIEGNVLRGNQQDLLLVRGDGSTVMNNCFEGRTPGYRPGGLLLSGENVLVATNRFEALETGILLIGDDPDFGTYLGIASNVVLTANGFCDVDTEYTFEPLTSYTEENTLDCPPPTLDIRAVQLSWPCSLNGQSVETAPDADGPWSTLNATPTLQDGQDRLVLPAKSDQGFFRLRKQ